MKHTFRKQHFSSLCNGCLLLVLGATFLFGACADDDLTTDKPGKHTGTTVAFNVSDAQMEALAQAGAKGITRGLSPQPLSSADLAPRKLEATGSNSHDFCLIESTVEGINPVKPAEGTRAEIIKTANLGNFSSIGYRAASSTAAANPSTALLWFHGEKTNPDGTLNHRYDWDWPVNVYGRFYAVYPEATPANKITLSPSNYVQVPYVDFEVNQDVKQQKDLMTACSGEVHYIHGNDPTSNLKFRHALAAVKFSIGSNLSPVIIKKIELKNVKYKGRYRLSNQADGSDATWTSVDNATTTMTLDNINMNAAEMPNTMLAGALDPDPNNHNRAGRENYTFLMIPQTMPAKTATNAIKAVIHYQDGATTKTITIPLTGEWKANTTMEYKLSQKNSSWEYHLTLEGLTLYTEGPGLDFYPNETNLKQFKVNSWREGIDPENGSTIKQAVTWKIIGYEESTDGAQTWVDKGMTKPAWLTTITEKGTGSAGSAEEGNVGLKNELVDYLAAYNEVLQKSTPIGSKDSYYDLSTHDVKGNPIPRNTANCYIISHPGYYKIPLVYGNAIKNGATNANSYTSTLTDTYVLSHFKDHNEQNITDPWIEKTNGGANNGINGTKLIWADEPNLVQWIGTGIVHNGGEAYLQFEVKKENIKNGNAVVAVMKDNVVVWSWHLWFVHDDALTTTTCTNAAGRSYKFTQEPLGLKYTLWRNTAYTKKRCIKVKLEQTAKNHGIAQKSEFYVFQSPDDNPARCATTYYQFGRKDPIPGVKTVAEGTFNKEPSIPVSIQNLIQYPENYYPWTPFWYAPPYNDGYTYNNVWSANNKEADVNPQDYAPVVKTVYDPCPAGYHIPSSDAFTCLTFKEYGRLGYIFYNKVTNPDATLFFYSAGYYDGGLNINSPYGFYWSTDPYSYGSYILEFGGGTPGLAYNSTYRAMGYSVRPVADN